MCYVSHYTKSIKNIIIITLFTLRISLTLLFYTYFG